MTIVKEATRHCPDLRHSRVKVLAFYLPQFHPIPENDQWWCKGFTDWTNVAKARPLFPAHEQPTLPSELGFYDLRVPEVRIEQAALAREYGIDGFCYYYYWFGGKKLLERTLEEVVATGEPDLPFCICWANENWSRRWDGQDNDVLIAQDHSPEHDARFIDDVLPILLDPRYVRIGGRPMLLVYRANLLADPLGTAAIWREAARRAGLPGLHLAAVLGVEDPRSIGFDALVEFPPHHFPHKRVTDRYKWRNPEFEGEVFDYATGVEQVEPLGETAFPIYRGVMSRWDNTPRRGKSAYIFAGSSPELYSRWLESVIRESAHRSGDADQFIFVNAWNEWAEGAFLEPCRTYGRKYLEATREAVRRAASPSAQRSRATSVQNDGAFTTSDNQQELSANATLTGPTGTGCASLVCVVGIHRSGTSMIAKLLQLGGVDLGPEEDLAPAAPENTDGSRENLHLVELNDEVLGALGGAWDVVPSAEANISRSELRRLHAKARGILRSYQREKVWAWKDPGCSLTLTFWLNLFADLRLIICLRNPLEVAQSLHSRNRCSFEKGLSLWLQYYECLVDAAPRDRRLVTHFESYFQPRAADEVARLMRFVGIDEIDHSVGRAIGAIRADLRHNAFSAEDLVEAGVSRRILRLYARLCDEAKWSEGLDGIREAAEGETGGPPIPIDRDRLDLVLVRRELELQEKVGKVNGIIRDLHADIEALRGELRLANEREADSRARIELLNDSNRTLQLQLDRISRSKLWQIGLAYWRLRGLFSARLGDVIDGEAAGTGSAERSREDRYDVICFPIIDWDFRFQRPQQLMSRFADDGHRVFYISQKFRRSGPAYKLREVRRGVWEVSLRAPSRDVYTHNLSRKEAAAFFESLDTLRQKLAIGAAISIVQVPFWRPIATRAREELCWPMVYDSMDYHAGFSTSNLRTVDEDCELVRTADLVIVSSEFLEKAARTHNERTVMVRNGCDYEHFARIGPRVPGVRPVVGYYGAIAEWFDSNLVAELAEKHPEWDILLVGSTLLADLGRLSSLSNVTRVGEQPYADIPGWLAKFDVAIIPFKRVPLTEATNPVKVYEMLAGGKPVISVPIPEVVALGEVVRTASTADEFSREIEAALAEDCAERRVERKIFAAGQTWAKRYDVLEPAVARSFPKASIVIVTYDNVELSRLCLESLYGTMDWPNFEVIVVDNASSDGTQAFLREAESTYTNLTVILNEENRGFAAANNQALRRSSGELLVLLNNDTVLCRGWLAPLARHLRSEPSIGLIGPSTNAIGNEGMIDVGYGEIGEMPGWAESYVREHDGETFDIAVLAMFCVAMRREVFDEIGELDEQFGIGMFEDDDYAHRMRDAGYRVVCARDAFVHHWMKAAFGKIPADEYETLFDRNRRLFEAKWGRAWVPHKRS